jgi:adenylosuccinate lyase
MQRLKGPVGTSADQLDLLGGDADTLAELERRVAAYLGFDRVLDSVGQVYPRSLDYDAVSALAQLAAAPSSLARIIRPMAGQHLVTEGFAAGQVGSSAMPHKMNARSSQLRSHRSHPKVAPGCCRRPPTGHGHSASPRRARPRR